MHALYPDVSSILHHAAKEKNINFSSNCEALHTMFYLLAA